VSLGRGLGCLGVLGGGLVELFDEVDNAWVGYRGFGVYTAWIPFRLYFAAFRYIVLIQALHRIQSTITRRETSTWNTVLLPSGHFSSHPYLIHNQVHHPADDSRTVTCKKKR
jgi:hypothetical protein